MMSFQVQSDWSTLVSALTHPYVAVASCNDDWSMFLLITDEPAVVIMECHVNAHTHTHSILVQQKLSFELTASFLSFAQHHDLLLQLK